MEKVDLATVIPDLHGLITRERAEKFDLLGQLILNQTEAIIVCGAEGIGKTTLLTVFKKEREKFWIICLLQGTETLSFEQIQAQLVTAIQQRNPELANHDLGALLSFCEQQQQKVVLMIDDAGVLAVGLITALTEYSLNNPLLRIVFAFTREQLYLKNITDREVDDCYFMELPPLTKPQMAVFLQELSRVANAEDDLEISDEFIRKLYQHTAGIPGKIVAEFPLLIELSGKKSFIPLKAALSISIVLMVAVLFYINSRSHDNDLPKTPPVLSKSSSVPIKVAIKPDLHTLAKQNNVVKVSDSTQKQPELNKITGAEVNNQAIQQDADELWILQQKSDQYTLQLMALSKRQVLLDIAKKYHNLEAALKILRVKNRRQEKYLLLYGAFADAKTASVAASLLPAEFRRAWPRKIDLLQQEIKNRPLPLLKQLPSKQ